MTTAERLNLPLDELIPLLYKAGGINPSGYGFISGGYGGGIDQDEFFSLLYWRGVITGISLVDMPAYLDLLRECNERLKVAYPDEITNDNLPFVNLT